VIQLKKVLSNNPKYVRAHQLLALLYMNTEEWEKARRELEKCEQIDTGNTTTQRYLKEVTHMLFLLNIFINSFFINLIIFFVTYFFQKGFF
jgi:lipopolysaccharide biosynthesis regulator YciM